MCIICRAQEKRNAIILRDFFFDKNNGGNHAAIVLCKSYVYFAVGRARYRASLFARGNVRDVFARRAVDGYRAVRRFERKAVIVARARAQCVYLAVGSFKPQ